MILENFDSGFSICEAFGWYRVLSSVRDTDKNHFNSLSLI
jgi:hypothetical protein